MGRGGVGGGGVGGGGAGGGGAGREVQVVVVLEAEARAVEV